jgi:hypothetical protein
VCRCPAKPQIKIVRTCRTVLVQILLFLHPGLLQLSPLLCHVHLSQNRAGLVSFDRLLCR